MSGLVTTRVSVLALALSLVAMLVCAPHTALAAPGLAATAATSTASPAELAAKRLQQAATQTRLRQLQADLETRVNDYVAIARELQRTRAEILAVSAQLEEQTAAYERARLALKDRAVQLYRGDRMGLLELLLDSRSVQDLVSRAFYLTTISQRDSRLLSEVRLARSETMWLSGDLDMRVSNLSGLLETADAQRSHIESDMAEQQVAANSLGADIAKLMAPMSTVAGGS